MRDAATAAPLSANAESAPAAPRRSLVSFAQSLARAAARDGNGVFPHWLLAAALAVATFYDYFLNRIHNIVTPLSLLFVLIWAAAMLERHDNRRRAFEMIALGAAWEFFALVFCRFYSGVGGGASAAALQKLLVIAPASVAIGWALVRCGRVQQYLSWFLAVGLVTVAPAIAERGLHRQLLRSGRSYARGGAVRALVGTPQPLVLAALFVAMIPLAFYLLGRWRYLGGLWLLAGVFMTGSNGPEAVGVVILIVCAVPLIPRLALRTAVPALSAMFAGAVALVAFGIYMWSPQIQGASTSQVSNGYRESLYWLLPRLLDSHPAGYGLAGLPANTWFFATQRDIVDVASSIDSEVVYSATQLGWFGVALFLAVAVVGVIAITRNEAVGLSNLAITLCGFFLAIHAWNSLSSLWFFGAGASAALAFNDERALRWHGLSARREAATTRPLSQLLPATG